MAPGVSSANPIASSVYEEDTEEETTDQSGAQRAQAMANWGEWGEQEEKVGLRVQGTELPLQHGSHPGAVRRISQAGGRGPQETLVPFPLAERPRRQWT